MDEQRQFFRIKNKGEIKASLAETPLDVINISSSGMLIAKLKIDFPKHGKIELTIDGKVMYLFYDLLRVESDTMVLVFKKQSQLLFKSLKKLRSEQNKNSLDTNNSE